MKFERSLSFDQKLRSKIGKQKRDVSLSRLLATTVAELLDTFQNEQSSFNKVVKPKEGEYDEK